MDAGSLTAPKAKVDAVQSSAGVQDRSHVLAVAGVHTRVLLSAIIIISTGVVAIEGATQQNNPDIL